MASIEIQNVTKYYGKSCALRDITLRIEENRIYGLLGRNGAGKTTLLNLMTNRLFPTAGEITIDGVSIFENEDVCGKIYCMAESNLYPEGRTVKSIFQWTKEFYPSFDMGYALKLCEKFGLNPNKKIKSLSTGYNTISKLITTLASNAEILMFDEPILGLDAYHRDLFYKELLKGYIESPKTIILSTHIIEEIADILENVIIIKDKTIALNERVEDLLKSAYCVSGPAESIEKYLDGRNCVNIDRMASFMAATVMEPITAKDKEMARKLDLEVSGVELQKLFIYLTGERGEKQ